MVDPALRTELMRSLGRLTRGLSALFWGLPATLLVSVQAAAGNWLQGLGSWAGLVPALGFGLLFYGVWLMSDFQKQERVWVAALDQAKLVSLVCAGFSPFLGWYQRQPQQSLFGWSVILLGAVSILLMMSLNRILRRLAAMLPDETLRLETVSFTSLNGVLLSVLFLTGIGYFSMSRVQSVPTTIAFILEFIGPVNEILLLFLVLLPLAVTMSLTWKIKEAILVSVFGDSPG